jgi:transcriptional regulator with PAS, ATPase and Fis domain
LAAQAAESDSPVLIVGESGTGKELFAHAIHQISRRRNHNFVKINSASIPGELIESELFGYEPGAFTGARKQGKPGKFELAHRGTIFLDEIGDMPHLLQVKLMRVLQEKEVERIGGKTRQIDFRVISATNLDLEAMVREKTFRLDLFYRLNVIIIRLPPLRDIREDILPIFTHFLKQLSRENHRDIPLVSPQAASALQQYAWPGNIRELRNVAERAMIVCRGGEGQIEIDNLPMSVTVKQAGKTPRPPASSLKTLIENAEREAILQALDATRNNRNTAAALLKIHRTGLYQKMKKYHIS